VAGWLGVSVRVVSRGSCARAAELTAQSIESAAIPSVKMRPHCRLSRAELVVCVSLTHERTVYFTL
jgi:hypothetical protein